MMQETTIPYFSDNTPNFNAIIGFVDFTYGIGPYSMASPTITFDCVVDDILTNQLSDDGWYIDKCGALNKTERNYFTFFSYAYEQFDTKIFYMNTILQAAPMALNYTQG